MQTLRVYVKGEIGKKKVKNTKIGKENEGILTKRKKGSNHNVYLCKKHPVLHLRHQVGKTYLRVLFFTHLN